MQAKSQKYKKQKAKTERDEKVISIRAYNSYGLATRRLFFVAGTALLSFALYFSAHWAKVTFQATNKNINYPLNTSSYEDSKLDPMLDVVYDQYFYFGFNFPGKQNSKVVQELKQKQLGASDLLSSNEYGSLFDILRHLYVKGRYADEYEALEFWIHSYNANKKFSTANQARLLKYVEELYVEPIKDCLTNYQFSRALWLAGEAVRRIRLVNTPPLYAVDPYLRERINKILTVEALLSKPTLCFKYAKEVIALLEISMENFPESSKSVLEKLTSDVDFLPLKNYWMGVYEFRSQDYSRANKYFSEASTIKGNYKLRDLSLLMQARCLFWAYKAQTLPQNNDSSQSPRKDVANPQNELRQLQSVISEPRYKDDVQVYIDCLGGSKECGKD